MKEQSFESTVENVVASASLDHGIDLDSIKRGMDGVDYDPDKFPGLIFRLKRPKTSILLFKTGKIICSGASSEKEAYRAIRKTVKKLRENHVLLLSEPRIEIVNVVSSGDLGGRIDLEFASDILSNSMYEPEQFPGLIYRMDDPKVVFLIFASGKVVCTGASSEKDTYEATKRLMDIIDGYDLFYEDNGI